MSRTVRRTRPEQSPAAACDVRDREDGVQPAISGPDASRSYTATCSYTDKGGKTGAAATTYTVEGL